MMSSVDIMRERDPTDGYSRAAGRKRATLINHVLGGNHQTRILLEKLVFRVFAHWQ